MVPWYNYYFECDILPGEGYLHTQIIIWINYFHARYCNSGHIRRRNLREMKINSFVYKYCIHHCSFNINAFKTLRSAHLTVENEAVSLFAWLMSIVFLVRVCLSYVLVENTLCIKNISKILFLPICILLHFFKIISRKICIISLVLPCVMWQLRIKAV